MYNLFLNYFKILLKIGISKHSIFLVLLSSFLCVTIELFGIAIFFPITDIFNNNFENLNIAGNNINLVKYDKYQILIFIAIAVYITYFIKSAILILNSILISKVWNQIDTQLKQNIYNNILKFNYREFIKKSNSSYSNLIIVEAEKFAELIKIYSLFVVELIILLLIFSLLMYSNFITSFITLFFLLSIIIIIYIFFKERLKRWGFERQKFQDEYQNDIKSGLTSFLSIRVNGGLLFFMNKFLNSLIKRNFIIQRQYIYENIPKSILEFSGLTVIIFTSIFQFYILGNSTEEIIGFLIILGVSFYRILPSFNRILSGYNQIIFSKAINDIIEKYVNLYNDKKELNKVEVNKIILRDVSFYYKEGITLFENISIDINKGDIIGIYGKSGSGKSTLIKLIMGLIKCSSGQIFIDDQKISDKEALLSSKLFGYLEQNIKTFNSTIRDNITLGGTQIKYDPWYNEVLKICNISQLEKDNLGKIIVEDGLNISGGELQRIGLARILYNNPQVFILDEFTSALDEKNKKLIFKTIMRINKKLNKTIILVSHDNSFKKFCDKIIQL